MAKKSKRKTNGRKPIKSVRPSRAAAEFNQDYKEIKNEKNGSVFWRVCSWQS